MIRLRHGIIISIVGTLTVLAPGTHAQQWNGPVNPNGNIWRPGNVAVGEEPLRGPDPRAMIEVTSPFASSNDQNDRLFSANMLFKGNTSPRFEVDTRRAYAGGARGKASILPADLDFAVHRSAAIGVVNMNEKIPSGYKLIVGGNILAEEVRIKLIKEWADYVFEPDYPLKSLYEVETVIRDHHRLPGIPSATDVANGGIELGHMQTTLLAKIEELTLYMIEQKNELESLRSQVTQLRHEKAGTTLSGGQSPADPHGERIER